MGLLHGHLLFQLFLLTLVLFRLFLQSLEILLLLLGDLLGDILILLLQIAALDLHHLMFTVHTLILTLQLDILFLQGHYGSVVLSLEFG